MAAHPHKCSDGSARRRRAHRRACRRCADRMPAPTAMAEPTAAAAAPTAMAEPTAAKGAATGTFKPRDVTVKLLTGSGASFADPVYADVG